MAHVVVCGFSRLASLPAELRQARGLGRRPRRLPGVELLPQRVHFGLLGLSLGVWPRVFQFLVCRGARPRLGLVVVVVSAWLRAHGRSAHPLGLLLLRSLLLIVGNKVLVFLVLRGQVCVKETGHVGAVACQSGWRKEGPPYLVCARIRADRRSMPQLKRRSQAAAAAPGFRGGNHPHDTLLRPDHSARCRFAVHEFLVMRSRCPRMVLSCPAAANCLTSIRQHLGTARPPRLPQHGASPASRHLHVGAGICNQCCSSSSSADTDAACVATDGPGGQRTFRSQSQEQPSCSHRQLEMQSSTSSRGERR
jgi:hypothetical protein